MAYTQLQLDTLKDAIAQGALTVKYGDKEITYRSLNEMIRIKNIMEVELGLVRQNNRTQGEFHKGLK